MSFSDYLDIAPAALGVMSGLVVAALTIVTLLFLALRGAAGGDARRDRDRRARGARRRARPHIAALGRVPGTRGQWGDVARHPENEAVPGIVVLRPESGLWFANADAVRDAIRAEATGGTRAVVVDAETVPAIDVTAVGMLVQLAEDLRRDGIELVLARDIGAVRDLVEAGGEERVLRSYPTVQAAVDELSGQS